MAKILTPAIGSLQLQKMKMVAPAAKKCPPKKIGFSRQDIELEADSHLGAGACGVAPRLRLGRDSSSSGFSIDTTLSPRKRGDNTSVSERDLTLPF